MSLPPELTRAYWRQYWFIWLVFAICGVLLAGWMVSLVVYS